MLTFLRQILFIAIGQPTHPGNTPDEVRRHRAQAQQLARERRQRPSLLRDGWIIVRELLYALFAQPR